MKRFAFLLLLLSSVSVLAQEPERSEILDSNISPQLELLGTRKLDVRPRDVLPVLDNMYILGNSNYRWKGLNVVSATFTSLTVSSAAVGTLYFGDGTSQTSAVVSVSTSVVYPPLQLKWINTNVVDVASNTSIANQTCVNFPDNTARCVTEDVASTSKYRRFITTDTAEYTSGTENSGLRTTYRETPNTWYAIYAVKSQINSANFVLEGSTVLYHPGNFATLDSFYGVNGWKYIGPIRNGTGATGNSDIIAFTQNGNYFRFDNVLPQSTTTVNAFATTGFVLANTAGATSLTWTYATGSGTAQVPPSLTILDWTFLYGTNTTFMQVKNSANTLTYYRRLGSGNNGEVINQTISANNGVRLDLGSGASIAFDAILVGFYDGK